MDLSSDKEYSTYELTRERWEDLEELFGNSGAYWGCWCMYWRLSNQEFNEMKSEERKHALRDLSEDGGYSPGLITYLDDTPIGWVGFGPRKNMKRIARSRVIPKVDDQDVLSVVCFYISPDYRNKGISAILLEATQQYAKEKGISVLEAYPVNTQGEDIKPVSAHCGVWTVFDKLGFEKIMKTKSKAGGKERVLVRFSVLN